MLGRFSTLFELRTIQYIGVMESDTKALTPPTYQQWQPTANNCYIPKFIDIIKYDLDIPTQLQFSNIKASYNI
jgi:hypothetical protein